MTGVEVKNVTPSDRPKPPPEFAGPDQPAVYVNWYEAKAYCEARGGMLPTGSQWEKAARGPQGNGYGTHSGALRKDEANYASNATVDVNSYLPNGYGVKNMTGNVWEWTLEDYPQHGTKGLRGGSWYDFVRPGDLAASLRDGDSAPVYRGLLIGLRCVAPSQDK